MTERELIRFLSKIKRDKDCWLWTAAKDATGYGRFWIASRSMQLPHRLAYDHFVGPIPIGKELDHLCRNRSCVNPDHLEPVTRRENVRRGLLGVLRPARTHCANGHPLNVANTYVFTRAGGYEQHQCRVCKRDDMRQRRNPAHESTTAAVN